MRNLLLAVLLVFAPLSASAADSNKWTWSDTALQTIFSGLLAADYAQTMHIARSKSQQKYFYFSTATDDCLIIWQPYAEARSQRFLGKYPSKGDVNVHFATILIGHAAVSYLLPKPYRTVWQSIYIIYEYDIVQDNRDIGLGLSMHF